jgi:hypothetical protein
MPEFDPLLDPELEQAGWEHRLDTDAQTGIPIEILKRESTDYTEVLFRRNDTLTLFIVIKATGPDYTAMSPNFCVEWITDGEMYTGSTFMYHPGLKSTPFAGEMLESGYQQVYTEVYFELDGIQGPVFRIPKFLDQKNLREQMLSPQPIFLVKGWDDPEMKHSRPAVFESHHPSLSWWPGRRRT